ncbi:MAG: 50S ribosomal protein L9 [Gammaproteobacteria bacterium]|nr:50S ribosomal protein L9 [Gammaproteobacteria bacterium]MAY03032.1 50S ribosomal protein L9 [Gammaproteobacteria bacterium]
MNVILLEKVGKIGDVGDKVEVKAGYARNFLFPFAKAVPATRENVAEYEARKEELLKAAQEKMKAAKARAEKLNGISVTIEANAGEEGKLFGSIGTRDIADALTAAGQEVEKSEVQLPEGAIRHTGDFEISLSLGSEVTAEINLKIVGTDAPQETVVAMEELEAMEAAADIEEKAEEAVEEAADDAGEESAEKDS